MAIFICYGFLENNSSKHTIVKRETFYKKKKNIIFISLQKSVHDVAL